MVHYSVLVHPPDSELPEKATSPTHQEKSSEDQAANGQEGEEEEEEDAFEDALDGFELQSSDHSPPTAQKGKDVQEGWMSEAAAIPNKLPSTSTEV